LFSFVVFKALYFENNLHADCDKAKLCRTLISPVDAFLQTFNVLRVSSLFSSPKKRRKNQPKT